MTKAPEFLTLPDSSWEVGFESPILSRGTGKSTRLYTDPNPYLLPLDLRATGTHRPSLIRPCPYRSVIDRLLSS